MGKRGTGPGPVARLRHEARQKRSRDRARKARERDEALAAKKLARSAREEARKEKAREREERKRRREQRRAEREARSAERRAHKDAVERAREFVKRYQPKPLAPLTESEREESDCECGHTARIHGVVRRACMVSGCRCERYSPGRLA